MKRVRLDRRALVKWGMSAGTIASIPFGRLILAAGTEENLLAFVSVSEGPIQQGIVGELSEVEFTSLFTLCEFVVAGWSLSVDMQAYRRRLRRDLSVKTTERPSYLVEYQTAAALIAELSAAGSDKVWPTLLFTQFEDVELGPTRLGRARRFVFAEIISHMIPVTGAFTEFGLVNYAGYMGGSFSEPDSYRRLAVQ